MTAIANVLPRASGIEGKIKALQTIAIFCGVGFIGLSRLNKLWAGSKRRSFLKTNVPVRRRRQDAPKKSPL
jgi:hypothetical protein